MKFENLYIHVPFCNGKCDYCAFYSEPEVQEDSAILWFRKIREDLKQFELADQLDTVYFGGGTPTALPPGILAELLDFLHTLPLKENAEISMECNPGSLTEEKAGILAGKINRISMGVQSFQTDLLKRIGRRTTPDQVARTIELLREKTGLKRLGLDLICALPRQTLQEWEQDLKTAVSFQPEHISAYMLIPEPGTPFTKRFGDEPVVSEELQTEMWELAGTFLESYGLPRYEISNHASLQEECRHNQNVWHGKTYLGLGPSACSFDGVDRMTNAAPLKDWLAGKEPEIDRISEDLRRREIFMMGLRTVRGWSQEEFNWEEYSKELHFLEEDGLIQYSGTVVKPTERGLLCWNTIAETLI